VAHGQRDYIVGETVVRKGTVGAGGEAPATVVAAPPLPCGAYLLHPPVCHVIRRYHVCIGSERGPLVCVIVFIDVARLGASTIGRRHGPLSDVVRHHGSQLTRRLQCSPTL
jgi:hypothetical protein